MNRFGAVVVIIIIIIIVGFGGGRPHPGDPGPVQE